VHMKWAFIYTGFSLLLGQIYPNGEEHCLHTSPTLYTIFIPVASLCSPSCASVGKSIKLRKFLESLRMLTYLPLNLFRSVLLSSSSTPALHLSSSKRRFALCSWTGRRPSTPAKNSWS
jgi:hypothetical protein